MKKDNLGRRDFLKKTGTAAFALTLIPRHVFGGKGFTPPSDQLTKGIIGVGGMGRGHINYEGTKLLAVCDVDKSQSGNCNGWWRRGRIS